MNFEEKNGLKKSYAIAYLVVLVLNVMWFISNIVMFKSENAFQICVPLVMFVISLFYVFYDYKKPHGNTIRYLLLIYAVYTGVMTIIGNPGQQTLLMAINIATIIFTTYMAGRLDKYKQNVIISIVILVLKVFIIYPYINIAIKLNALTLINLIKYLGPVSIWSAIAGAYIIRYKLHKEAGLEDKK